MVIEEIPGEDGELERLLAVSLKNGNSLEKARTHTLQRPIGRRKKGAGEANGGARRGTDQSEGTQITTQESLLARNCGRTEKAVFGQISICTHATLLG
jgi:hypothetical protein